MSQPVVIKDDLNQRTAKVTRYNQLVVAPVEYDTAFNATLDTNTKNLLPPIAGSQFVVTGIYLTAKKNITGDVIVEVFQANSSTQTVITANNDVFTVEMLKNTFRDITGLNLILNEGSFLNAKADDGEVLLTVTGYYIEG